MGKKNYKDILINDMFGRWKVIEKAEPSITPKGQKIPMWKCECQCDKHIIKIISDNALKTGNSKSCGCLHKEIMQDYFILNTYRKSNFYDWCIDNNRQDLLDRWDYNLNKDSPREISYCSHNKFYFKCQRELHESELFDLATISRSGNAICKKCNSFAQYGIDLYGNDFLEKYWDYDKNIVSPWEISICSTNRVWIICQENDYHGSYDVLCFDFKKGVRCAYCSSRKVHPKDSFAQYLIDLYGNDALDIYWDYNKNNIDPWQISKSCTNIVYIICQNTDYHGSYSITANDFYNKCKKCPYCLNRRIHSKDSLGYNYPLSVELWSDKNKKTPYEYAPKSNQVVWWKCLDGKHEDYKRKINDSLNCEFRCPDCSRERTESMLQEKVRLYINDVLRLNTLHESKCTIVPKNPKTKFNLPFDNEVVALKLIIEVHGKQHYEIDGFHYMNAKHYNITLEESLKQRKLYDRYKKAVAECKGYFYLEIPYWTEKDESYKKLIDEKIEQIKLLEVA